MTVPSAESPGARQYARIRYRLLLSDLALSWLALSVFQFSGASASLARWWTARVPAESLIILGYLAGFGSVYYLVSLPLHFYGSFLLEHRFGLSRLTLRGWLTREAKQIAVGAVLGTGLVEGLYLILRHAPGAWPIWATLGWVGVSVVLARIFPTVLLPIFYKTTPVNDEALVQQLLALCHRVGVSALGNKVAFAITACATVLGSLYPPRVH